MGWVPCVGLLYEHSFAVLIMMISGVKVQKQLSHDDDNDDATKRSNPAQFSQALFLLFSQNLQ